MTVSRKDHLDSTAIGLLLACCLFWGFQQVMVKATLPELAPVFQAALRFLGATVLLLLWCRWRGKPMLTRTSDGHSRVAAGLLAGGLFATEFACLYIGLQHTTASRLTLFLYTSPFWVALLLPLRVRSEHLRPAQWLGLLCAFVAVGFALREGFAGSTAAGTTWLGDLLALAAGLTWGLTTVVIRSTRLGTAGAEEVLLWQLVVSAALLPLLSLALGEHWHFSDWSTYASVSMAVQTLVGAFGSYLAWMWMLGRYPATRISVFVFLTPIFTLLFGALWLGEPVTPGLLAALALVALGIVLVNRRA